MERTRPRIRNGPVVLLTALLGVGVPGAYMAGFRSASDIIARHEHQSRELGLRLSASESARESAQSELTALRPEVLKLRSEVRTLTAHTFKLALELDSARWLNGLLQHRLGEKQRS